MILSTIRARIHPDGAITVHHKPRMLAWIFGALSRDYEVEYASGWWVGAVTGRPVSWRAAKAIERVVRRAA